MKRVLFAVFYTIFTGMIAVSVVATLERGVFTALADLWSDAWFRATLADAYCGFLTFYCWVAYRETGWTGRLVWLVAILYLGNIAMSVYVLACLWGLPAGAPLWQVLLRSEHRLSPEIASR